MLRGSSKENRARWELGAPGEYHYLNQSGCYSLNYTPDAEAFAETQHAMKVLGFSDAEQDGIWQTLAALLHLGNVNFELDAAGTDDGCIVSPASSGSLVTACRLLGVPSADMDHVLRFRELHVGPEVTLRPLHAYEAAETRDALSKKVYSAMFDFIVHRVNTNVDCTASTEAWIGCLDIFGFETFKVNSFEQLCINYANEALQQQFNMFVFKLKIQEYKREGIRHVCAHSRHSVVLYSVNSLRCCVFVYLCICVSVYLCIFVSVSCRAGRHCLSRVRTAM